MIRLNKKMIKKISIKTKFGWISAFEKEGEIFLIKFGKVKQQSQNIVLKNYKKKLLKFFNRKSSNIDTSHIMNGNQIQRKIWNELKKIKIGQTKTYGEIAKKYKISPRHVGKICSQNVLLLLIPCHRVIRSDGSIGGFTSIGGTSLKKKLIEFEKSWK